MIVDNDHQHHYFQVGLTIAVTLYYIVVKKSPYTDLGVTYHLDVHDDDDDGYDGSGNDDDDDGNSEPEHRNGDDDKVSKCTSLGFYFQPFQILRTVL